MSWVDFLLAWIRAWLPGNWIDRRRLAACYATGDGPILNPARARVWYRRAARAGDLSAEYDLGLMMLHGEGGPVNLAEGRRLLEGAAERGDGGAQKILAYYFRDGSYGLPMDLETSEMWKAKAEAQGLLV